MGPRPDLRLLPGILLIGLAWGGAAPVPRGVADEPSAEDVEFFEKRVRPILAARCLECHGPNSEKLRGGLRLDSREAVLQGGESGPAAIPGEPHKSLLVDAIGYQNGSLEMPPAGKLPDREIAELTEWVRRGLPYPGARAVSAARPSVDLEAGRRHWAFQEVREVNLGPWLAELHSAPQDSRSQGTEVESPRVRTDVLVAAMRLRHQVPASPPAPPPTLARRSAFLLMGLPPDPEESESLIADPSPDAYARWVDRLLASPAMGERWGRHWLDLTRYCDVPEQWREGEARAYLYRDWVVRAYNADLPFADFVRRQLAADLLPDTQPADNAALGFLGLSPTYWKELKLDHLVIKQVVAEEWEEQIEAIGGTFLGLTLACARCHDHKYDPITMRDYYGLAGVLASIRLDDTPVIPAEPAAKAREARQRVTALEKEIEKLKGMKPVSDENQKLIDAHMAEIERLRRDTPFFHQPPAFGVSEASLHVLPDGANRTRLEYRSGQPQDIALQIRGNPAKPGDVIPRRFLSVLARDPSQRFERGSGRRELADAIVDDARPLAARVYVNRLWNQVFGRGLVTTPSNFGTQAERPSHPELLDDLAARFLHHGGSTKWLLRELLTSATFRQSSTQGTQQTLDPENIWLGRMPVRRLDVESWRDAMLAASHQLDRTLGGPPRDLLDPNHVRRTLYGSIKRRELNDLLRLFDFPDPVAHNASRDLTTTPLQQLFVLNSPFFQHQATALANWVRRDHPESPAAQVRAAYRQLFGRAPSAEQLAAGIDFLTAVEREGQSPDTAWRQYAQVLLASNEMLYID